MEVSKSIGFKRLFLTRSQKYSLDIQRLLSKEKPDKAEQFIIFLENLAPSVLLSRGKRLSKKAIIFTYWSLAPKRIRVTDTTLTEYLPWFKGRSCDYFLLKKNLGKGVDKICIYSTGRGGNRENYTYSWKKAYFMMKTMKKQREQEIAQYKLDRALAQLKGE